MDSWLRRASSGFQTRSRYQTRRGAVYTGEQHTSDCEVAASPQNVCRERVLSSSKRSNKRLKRVGSPAPKSQLSRQRRLETALTTQHFFAADFPSTLFPLQTVALLIANHAQQLSEHVYQKILSDSPQNEGYCFLPQQRVFAAKPRNHLRRTVCLDPVATYYLYDLVYRNRGSFRKPVSDARKSYGYRFENGSPIPVHDAYMEFLSDIDYGYMFKKHSLRFDIASYFNSIYHHDLAHWFEALPKSSEEDTAGFGKFLREINSGRSIDLLPQGLYPSKMIGSEFLKFVELTKEIKSEFLFRFMDDFFLFDDNESVITQDFIKIQELLGSKALNINPSKTAFGAGASSVKEEVSEIKAELIEFVEIPLSQGVSSFGGEEHQIITNLTEEQISRLLDFLVDERAEESDVELILTILKDHSDSLGGVIGQLLNRFPSVAKQINIICAGISDTETLANEILDLVSSDTHLIEFQLFWIAVLCEERLMSSKRCGDILLRIYERSTDFPIARAKILEIPDQNHGFKEIRDGHLKSGGSHWLTWASAAGSRSLKKSERNYLLDYFSKGSPINFLIASCIKSL
jgi:hypothetical protein